MIEHVHGCSEQDAEVRLTGAPAEDLRQEGFSTPGLPMITTLVPRFRKSSSSRRRMRFLACWRDL
jgi:hypothetical protein